MRAAQIIFRTIGVSKEFEPFRNTNFGNATKDEFGIRNKDQMMFSGIMDRTWQFFFQQNHKMAIRPGLSMVAQPNAPLAKVVYAADLKSVGRKTVPVQVRQGAPFVAGSPIDPNRMWNKAFSILSNAD